MIKLEWYFDDGSRGRVHANLSVILCKNGEYIKWDKLNCIFLVGEKSFVFIKICV